MKYSILASATAAAFALGPMSASAVTSIDPTAYTAAGCLTAATCSIVGSDGTTATLTALPDGATPPATFVEQNYGDVVGLGVDFLSGAGAENEIQFGDPNVEGIRIEYDRSQIINEIRLGHFYHDTFFGVGSAEPDETALITAFSGVDSRTLTVTRTGDSSFTTSYTGLGTGATVSEVSQGGTNPFRGGLVSLTGLFSDLVGIDKLEFFAGDPLNTGDTSDYSINLTTSVVPVPFGALLIGTAFVGAGALRRFGRKAA